ncbi:MAG: large conductance mechanosensitive channel protein MscL [Clostridia bacterium]|nr:large conductance mechanosensitive channel protein MscL [Oscillospiraceae bacterium]MBQ7034054.1 large conductance mechanosensitive channel protein MscL [Clostridia bacterium]
MKKFLHEFKEFIMRGNVVDLAVGVIIGAAFKAIVDSLVKDVVSPAIGIFAKQDFSSLVLRVRGVEIRYGAFITAVINFLIMAFVIFLLVKTINAIARIGKKKEEPKEEKPTTKKCTYCCSEIAIEATRCPHCTSLLEE